MGGKAVSFLAFAAFEMKNKVLIEMRESPHLYLANADSTSAAKGKKQKSFSPFSPKCHIESERGDFPGKEVKKMSKKLQMTFVAEDEKTSTVSLNYPVADLKLSTVKTAAADMMPVFVNSDDSPLSSLKEAKYIETIETPITD